MIFTAATVKKRYGIIIFLFLFFLFLLSVQPRLI